MTKQAVGTTAALALLCTLALGRLEWRYLAPSPRSLATIVVDTPNQRAVLFGGGAGGDLNDAWTLSMDTTLGYGWRPMAVSGTPPTPRHGHAAVFDPIHDQLVVFGGRNGGTLFNDVWTLDMGTATWQQQSPTGTPPAGRAYISAAYCPARRSMITLHGTDLSGAFDDVFELLLDSMQWHQILPSGNGPEARWSYNVFLDPDSNRLIMFGGQTGSGQFENDVWALSLETGSEAWTELNPSGSVPEGRSNCATGYDEAGRQAYFFGGFNYNQGVFYNDLYRLDMNTLSWADVSPGGTMPLERRCPTGIFDAENRNFFCFGGETYDGFTSEGLYVHVGTLGVANWHGAEPIRPPWLSVTPLNPNRVRIKFHTPKSATATLKVLDQSGRVVRSLLSGPLASGDHELVWDGKDERGNSVASGSYFCMLEADRSGLSEKFVLTR
jgi:hypothetical protein